MSKQKKEKKSFLSLLVRNLVGNKNKNISILEEEQMQSPFRTVLKNFGHNKIAMTGLIVFLLIFAFVIIGPFFYHLDLSYSETSQINMAPGFKQMKMPSALNNNAAYISQGATFAVGVSNDGEVYVWGQPKISTTINMKKQIPENMGKVTMVAAGYDHALALNEDGEVFGWGNDRLKQSTIPHEVYAYGKVVQIAAGYQISAAVTEDGYVVFWGNESVNDVRVKKLQQGKIEKVAFTADAMIGLTYDGEVLYLGKQETAYKNVPETLASGVVDIAATASTCAGLLEDGTVVVWGNITKGENMVPETTGKITSLSAGRYHYSALTDAGEVVAWGADDLGQIDVPSSLSKKGITALYSGYYQNYAVTDEGKVYTWGLKGYLLGTDGLGRDIMTRLVNGGKMTMTIGAVSVIISTIIGIIVGGISGFFGGKIDMLLQRFTEIVSALPFLPFAMILSSIVGNSIPETQRIMLIMVVLGVLSWPGLSRLVRAQVLAEREKEFVTAARAMGVKKNMIIFKHIIPNVVSTIIVSATLDFATCMLTESTLSYLGFGVALPRPTWGNMLTGSNNSVIIQNYWWQWVFAAVILSICVICINCVGDGLRDAIDPKSNER
ncbi:MAG: ABC transporter permease subunit [Lachnospiraceae bacterium]|nr:ABC transporter permease subunit [Lachnospiraceae bacterium]